MTELEILSREVLRIRDDILESRNIGQDCFNYCPNLQKFRTTMKDLEKVAGQLENIASNADACAK